jgi:hypothetical protein
MATMSPSWWLAHYNPAEGFGPTALERLEQAGELARSFELGPQALVALVIENSGKPDDRHVVIVRRFRWAEARRYQEEFFAGPTEAELAFVRRLVAEEEDVQCA